MWNRRQLSNYATTQPERVYIAEKQQLPFSREKYW